MSSNAALTMAVLMKEAISNMSDTLDTKKEIEEYFKSAMKVINEKKKEEEKAKKAAIKAAEKEKPATKKRGAKKEKEKEVDEEGNEVVKAKKPLSNYMKFMEEHRDKVKTIVQGLSPKELFTEVAKLWKFYKEFKAEHDGKEVEEIAELWETKLEELLNERKEELNAEKASDEEEKEEVAEVAEVVEEVAEVVEEVAEKKKGGKKKAGDDEIDAKVEKKVKTAKATKTTKKPKKSEDGEESS